jgi:hypothetical protein
MTRLRSSQATALVLLFAVCIFASLSHAGTVTTVVLGPTDTNGVCTGSTSGASCGGYQFTISFDQTTSILTFTVQPGPSAQPAYLQGFGLTLFNGNITATPFSSNPAGFTVVSNAKVNNGNDSCTSQTHSGSLCVQKTLSSSNGPLIGSNGLTFQFTISGWTSVLSSWHIMATGTSCALGSGPRCGNVFALTNDATPAGPPPPVPEPSSLVLLGSGLLGAGGFIRRKIGL